MIDNQARQLSGLSCEVSAQDRMIERRLHHIQHLEKQLSHIRGVKPPASTEAGF
ncbi:hypothetical protein LDENG_00282500 [Lucifuga dentata]|nr:hypothetical protein LDENG_00282500 [Lucifuga dentata]